MAESDQEQEPISVHLLSVGEGRNDVDQRHLYAVRCMREMARIDRAGQFVLVDDPNDASLVLFVESHANDSPAGPYLGEIRKHPVYRAHRDRCYVHCGADMPIVTIPGIYPSIERVWAWRSIVQSGSYLVQSNPFLEDRRPKEGPFRYLASFVGCARAVPIRQRLVAMKDERMHLSDNTSAFIGAIRGDRTDEVDRLKKQFVEIALASRFILCPRGSGASSIRLFEAMQLGRAPVVISDKWVEPEGPDWSRLCIRVREKDVQRLPAILRDREARAGELGANARAAWENYFAPETHFHHICHTIWDMHRSSGQWQRRSQLAASRLAFFRPFHARRCLRLAKNAMLSRQ